MRTGSLHPVRVRKRLCVSFWGGKQSIYFSRFRKYFVLFGYFVKNCNYEYRIRIRFIELYMVTWLKAEKKKIFRKFTNNVPEV